MKTATWLVWALGIAGILGFAYFLYKKQPATSPAATSGQVIVGYRLSNGMPVTADTPGAIAVTAADVAAQKGAF